MAVRIIGLDKLHRALVGVTKNIHDLTPITKALEEGMRKHAHVDTGYMKSTVYHKPNMAGASAEYAGFEADRGGEHDFAQKAIDDFDPDEYLDKVVKPF